MSHSLKFLISMALALIALQAIHWHIDLDTLPARAAAYIGFSVGMAWFIGLSLWLAQDD